MSTCLQWFNETHDLHPFVKAAVAKAKVLIGIGEIILAIQRVR
ncbi:hypothetical protein QE435_005060 [Rhizobium sp. SORGH_AS 787]|nr:hypothetical protein [Rhizobium sp. SORGH_AS_0787]